MVAENVREEHFLIIKRSEWRDCFKIIGTPLQLLLLVVLHKAGVSSAKHARDIIIESSFFLWDISP